jgi:hypothetical protein
MRPARPDAGREQAYGGLRRVTERKGEGTLSSPSSTSPGWRRQARLIA